MKKGIDAPFVPVLFIVAGVLGIIPAYNSHNPYNLIFPVIMITMAVSFIHTSLFGKYRIIHQVVSSLNIPKDSKVLDLGTGHGAVLLEVAKRLKSPGKVIGIDIWQSADQSSNSQSATQHNIKQADVEEVAKIQTANMTNLPFTDNEFDYVFASFAIHNVKPKKQRELAISEALRVLKHSGQLIIIDMEHIGEFKRYLIEHECIVNVHRTGINGIWGWIPTSVINAKSTQPK